MSKVINTIKLAGKTDLSSIREMKEKQTQLVTSKTEPELDTSEIDHLLQQFQEMEMQMELAKPVPLTKEEVVYRRSLIMKCRRWRETFPDRLKEFPKDFAEMDIVDLENHLEEMRFLVSTQNSANFAVKSFETGVFLIEQLHDDFAGLSMALVSDKNTLDIIKEMTLEYQEYTYSKPEHRLGMAIMMTMNNVRSSNRKKRLVSDVLDKTIDVEIPEEFEDL